MSLGDITRTVVKEEVVLEKFNGDPEDGDIAERIVLVNGEMVSHEVFENGKLISSTEGGNNGTN